jgi:outer membrane protein OmpA-like peptidoglycan-associated protein
VYDDEDACPDVPGVRTDDPKTNGCPERPDRDHDGVYDDEDACPDVPGVRTDDPKTNGCPPPSDRDGDGVLDSEDACPDVPGVRTDDPKTNGCPPPKDSDGDGIMDDVDACPHEPGPADPDPKKNGCPLAHIDVEKHEIVILQQVKFAFDKDTILPESNEILEAVLKILNEHPEITMVHIEGHTDNKGSAKYNKGLSDRRSKSVMKWLVQHGVAPKRMTAKGFGLERPIDTNETDAGRQNNRRVEFHIEGGVGVREQ